MTGSASAAAGGKPKSAPMSLPTQYQKPIAISDQATTEMKKSLGRGKKETNTSGIPFVARVSRLAGFGA
jgi:hypothetical protein